MAESMNLGLQTVFKLEDLGSLESKIRERLSEISNEAMTLKINNIEFDENAIREKIEHLMASFNNMDFKAKVPLGDIEKAVNLAKEIQRETGNINIGDGVVNKITSMSDGLGNLKKQTVEVENELGNITRITSQMGDNGKLESSQIRVTENYKQQRAEIEKAAEAQDKLSTAVQTTSDKLQRRMNELSSGKLKDNLDTEKINQIQQAINNFNPSTLKECTNQGRLLNNEISNLKSSAQTAFNGMNESSRGFLGSLKDMGREITLAFGATSLIYGFISALREGYETVSTLDKQLTDIKMTMDGTNSQFAGMVTESQKLGNQLGSTVEDVMNVATIYANANETISQIMQKSKYDVVLANISGMNSKQTTDAMQAFFNQFKLNTEQTEQEAQRIADSMTAVSKSMAMNFGDGIKIMMNGVKTAGSVFHEAGLSLEQAEAVIGTIGEVTRSSGEEIGNALKTIFSRMGRVKPTTKEGIEAINQTERSLKKIGVNLRDVDGHFRNTSTVLDEVAAKWNNLTKEQRSQIAEDAAGIRQKNYFISLMNNYGKYTDLVTKALNSQGEAMKANDIFADSLQGRVNKLKNAFMALYQNSLNSGTVKEGINLLTNLIQGIDLITSKFGLLGTVISLINAKALMSSKAFENFLKVGFETKQLKTALQAMGQSLSQTAQSAINGFNAWANGTKKAKDATNDLAKNTDNVKEKVNSTNKEIQDATKNVNKTTDTVKNIGKEAEIAGEKTNTGMKNAANSTTAASNSAKTASFSFKALAGSIDVTALSIKMLQGALSIGLSFGLTFIFEQIGKLVNKSKEAKKHLDDLSKEAPQKIADTGHLSALTDKMEKFQKQAKLTGQEQKELRDIQKQLAQEFPSAINGWDEEGNALATNTGAVREAIKARQELVKADLYKTIADNAGNVEKAKGKIDTLNQSLKEERQKLKEVTEECKKKGMTEDQIKEKTEQYTGAIQKHTKELNENKAIINSYEGAVKSLDGINKSIAEGVLKNINANKEHKASLEEMKTALENAGLTADEAEKALEQYRQELTEAADGNEKLKDSVDDTNESFNQQCSALEGSNNSLDFYNKVLKEFNEDGQISSQTLNTILEKHQELIPLLGDESTFREKLQEIIRQEQQTRDDLYNQVINQAIAQQQTESENADIAADNKSRAAANAANASIDAMDGATNGMKDAYKVDANNFQTLCNDKIDMANNSAEAIANAFNATLQSIGGLKIPTAPNPDDYFGKKVNGFNAPVEDSVFGNGKTYVPEAVAGKGNHVKSGYSGSSSHHGNNVPIGSGSGGGRGKRKGSGGGSGKKGKKGGSGSSSQEIKDLKLEIDRYKELNGRISALNSTLSYNKELEEQAAKTGKNEYIEKQIGLMNQLKNRYQDLQNEQYKERDELKSTLSANWFTFDGDGNINNYTSALKRLQDWSNQASGDDKKNRQDKVKEWQKDADKYIDLVSNKIPELDNKMLHINAEIKERLTKQTHIKIEILKDDLDKTIKEIGDKMKELDWKENTLGDKDLSSHMYIDTAKLNETSEKYDETLKMLNKLRNVSAQTEEAQKELKDSIRETENQLWEYSNAIQQLNEKIEQSRINNIKNVADDSKKALEYDRQMLDYRESQLSDKNTQHVEFAEAKLDNEAKKYTILTNQLNELNNLKLNGLVKTAKAQEELNESIKETTKETLEVCQNIQSLKEEIDSANLNNLSNKYDEDIKNVTESQSDLDSSINRLADDDKDLAQKLDLTNKKYEDQQQAIKITEEYLEKLKNTKAQTQKGEEELKEKIQETTDALREQKNAADELNKSMDEMILNTIDKVIDKQQSVEEKELEDKQKQENKALEEMYFKTTQTEYDEYKKNKIESLKEEIDLLKQKAEKEEDNHALLENVKAKELEIFDLENQHYDKIDNWYEVHQAMHQFKIDAIDKELEKMEEEDKLDKEKEDRLKYQNELLKAQQDIENIKRNKNIQQLKQEADGSWQYEYTYDIDKLDKAQKDYANKEKEYKKWEDDLAKKKKKDELNKKKQEEKQALDDLKANYDKQVKLLEEKHEKEKDEMSRKYEEMKIKTREYLKQLKEEYKNNWDAILEGLQKEIGLGDQALDMFHKKSIDKINDIYKQLDALVEKMQGLGIATSTQLNIKPIQIYDTSKLPSRMPEIKMPEMDNSKEEIKQEVHINAEFPDVNNADEIKEALESLSTSATQYLGRK